MLSATTIVPMTVPTFALPPLALFSNRSVLQPSLLELGVIPPGVHYGVASHFLLGINERVGSKSFRGLWRPEEACWS
jgi:hypothetical protein